MSVQNRQRREQLKAELCSILGCMPWGRKLQPSNPTALLCTSPVHAGTLLPTGQPTAAPSAKGTILSHLRQICKELGRGEHWDQQWKQDIPACCTELSQYAQGHKAASMQANFMEHGALELTEPKVLHVVSVIRPAYSSISQRHVSVPLLGT